MINEALRFVKKTGADTAAVFDDLARLRIAVFRDYPYLYEGSVAYEKEYLKIYSASEKSFIFLVYQEEVLIGATTCIPLSDESPEVVEPFRLNGWDIDSVFYFGESILLPEFRGLGIGNLFFDEREAFAGSFEVIRTLCFCSVDRGENHPMKPENYRSNEAFWLKRGYRPEPSLQATFSWPDTGETASSDKPMIFWIKNI